jgi:hypothetical protein
MLRRRGETRGEKNKDAHGLTVLTVLLEQQFLVTTQDTPKFHTCEYSRERRERFNL